MGMSTPRPALADAAIARRLLLWRRSSKIMDTQLPEESQEQRLPSTRPIDRRWDHSRGLIFQNAQRIVSLDHTWRPSNGIIFDNSPSTRGYASRNLYGSRGNTSPDASSASKFPKPAAPKVVKAPKAVNFNEIHRLSEININADRDTLRELQASEQQIKRLQAEVKELRQRVEDIPKIEKRREDAEQKREQLWADMERQRQREMDARWNTKETELKEHLNKKRARTVAEYQAKHENLDRIIQEKSDAARIDEQQRLQLEKERVAQSQSEIDLVRREVDQIREGAVQDKEETERKKVEWVTAVEEAREEGQKAAAMIARRARQVEEQADVRIAAEIVRAKKERDVGIERAKEEADEHAAARIAAAEREAATSIADATTLAQRAEQTLATHEDRLYQQSQSIRAEQEQDSRLRDLEEEQIVESERTHSSQILHEIEAGREQRAINGRANYQAYQTLWRQHSTTALALQKDARDLRRVVSFPPDGAKVHAMKCFDPDQIDPFMKHTYPKLSGKLHHLFQNADHVDPTLTHDLDTLLSSTERDDMALLRLAHRTRRQTRFHRFKEDPTVWEESMLLSYELDEKPMVEVMLQTSKKITGLQERLKRAADAPTRRELRQEIHRSIDRVATTTKVLRLINFIRRNNGLTALSNGLASDQHLFVSTDDIEEVVERALTAAVAFREEVPSEERSGLVGNVDISTSALVSSIRQDIDNYKEDYRKIDLILSHLGQEDSSTSSAKVSAELQEKSLQTQKNIDAALDQLVLGSGRGSRSTIRSSSFNRVGSSSRATAPVPLEKIVLRNMEGAGSDSDEGAKIESGERLQRRRRRGEPAASSLQRQIVAVKAKRRAPLAKLPPDQAAVSQLEAQLVDLGKKLARAGNYHDGVSPIKRRSSSRSSTERTSSKVNSAGKRKPMFRATSSQQSSRWGWDEPATEEIPSRPLHEFDGTLSASLLDALRKTWPNNSTAAVDHTIQSSITAEDHMQAGAESELSGDREELANDSSESAYNLDSTSSHELVSLSESEAHEASIEAGINEPSFIKSESLPMRYQIPSGAFRAALMASSQNTAAYWNHRLYRSENGKSPTVYYCHTYDMSESRARDFLNEPIVGFDIEWESYAKATSSAKQNVSLIQIAAEDKIALFHIAVFRDDQPEMLMPPSLRVLLSSSEHIKAGVNVMGDARRILKYLGVEMRGLCELSRLYRVVQFTETRPKEVNGRLVSLADQVQTMLGLPLHKGDVRTSSWSRRLQLEQSDYAATDAYAGYRVYHELEARRMQMSPIPEQPPLREVDQIVPRPVGRRVPRKMPSGDVVEVDPDDEEGDEFYDANEDFDEPAQSPDTTHSASYPTLPSELQQERIPQQTLNVQTAPPPKPTKRGQPPPSPAVDLANARVTAWIADQSIEYNLQVGRAQLRAYFIWHEQNLDCEEIARLLGNISIQTVAGYVLDVLRYENMPFNRDRLAELLGILPRSVHGRYYRVLERMEA